MASGTRLCQCRAPRPTHGPPGAHVMKALTIALLAAVISTIASAGGTGPSSRYDHERRSTGSTITVAVDGISCNTSVGASAFAARSWSWSAANESTSAGSAGGAARATVSSLSVKKAFDACSASLFNSVTSGRYFPRLTLTQRDSSGNLVATVELSVVLVMSWTVGSSVRDASPDEAVAFSFREVCLSSVGSPRQCFDTRS